MLKHGIDPNGIGANDKHAVLPTVITVLLLDQKPEQAFLKALLLHGADANCVTLKPSDTIKLDSKKISTQTDFFHTIQQGRKQHRTEKSSTPNLSSELEAQDSALQIACELTKLPVIAVLMPHLSLETIFKALVSLPDSFFYVASSCRQGIFVADSEGQTDSFLKQHDKWRIGPYVAVICRINDKKNLQVIQLLIANLCQQYSQMTKDEPIALDAMYNSFLSMSDTLQRDKAYKEACLNHHCCIALLSLESNQTPQVHEKIMGHIAEIGNLVEPNQATAYYILALKVAFCSCHSSYLMATETFQQICNQVGPSTLSMLEVTGEIIFDDMKSPNF